MARILVIEDNATNLQLMSYLLKAFGHTVTEALDGEDGLAQVQREAPDLIVCDVHIPGIDGYEVCRRLKSDPATRGIPIVAVTALAMVGDRANILAAGFDGYIAKPIEPENFVGQVEAYLGDGGARAEIPPPAPVPGPASAAREAADQERPAKEDAGTILLVDDLGTNIKLMRSILEPYGYRLLVATSVHEAVALLLEDERPDLIVSDVHMPDASGFALLERVQSEPCWRDIPFLFISGTSWPEGWEQHQGVALGLSLGAAGFLKRPVEPEALLANIAEHLAGSRG